MPELAAEIDTEVQRIATKEKYKRHPFILRLANEVIVPGADIEQMITFLEDSRSFVHQEFAADLRKAFSKVLRGRLASIRKELGAIPSDLYAVTLDMHEVSGNREGLRGFLTLNYDVYLEHAIERRMGWAVDHRISIKDGGRRSARKKVPLIKLHGSFGWRDGWPIESNKRRSMHLWIPPGVQKEKGRYPFNLLWGSARELLQCDILRIIGVNLGKNDWDLVSLLFTTQHAHQSKKAYEVEIIDWPKTAFDIQRRFPHLGAKSLLELDDIGEQIVSEMSGGPPARYEDLDPAPKKAVLKRANKLSNPFQYWLELKAEAMLIDPNIDSLQTSAGVFEKILEAP